MCKETYNGPNRAIHLNGPCLCWPTCRGSGPSMARHNAVLARPILMRAGPGLGRAKSCRASWRPFGPAHLAIYNITWTFVIFSVHYCTTAVRVIRSCTARVPFMHRGMHWLEKEKRCHAIGCTCPTWHPDTLSFLVSCQWRLLLLGPRRVGYRRTVYGVCHETSMLMVMW
jgi:hypothetical protein